MTVAAAVLATMNVTLLIWVLWMVYNVRDDVLAIRATLASERASRAADKPHPPLSEWLAEHPDRPYRDDPPLGPGFTGDPGPYPLRP